MEANQGQTENKRPSLIHGAFSFILPGSGQAIAGQLKRGIGLFFTFITLAGLSIWTVAQRARFPDLIVSAKIFWIVFLECAAILFFLICVRYLLNRFFIKDVSGQTFTQHVHALLLVHLPLRGGPEQAHTLLHGGAFTLTSPVPHQTCHNTVGQRKFDRVLPVGRAQPSGRAAKMTAAQTA